MNEKDYVRKDVYEAECDHLITAINNNSDRIDEVKENVSRQINLWGSVITAMGVFFRRYSDRTRSNVLVPHKKLISLYVLLQKTAKRHMPMSFYLHGAGRFTNSGGCCGRPIAYCNSCSP